MEPGRAGLSSGNGPLAARWKQKGKGQEGSEAKVDSEMVTLSEQVSYGVWWLSCPQGSRPSGIQHTSYFQCYLQLFIILKLHFSQIGLLISLSCTWISHHLRNSAHAFSCLECPLLILESTSSREISLFCQPQRVFYLSETILYIPFIKLPSLPLFCCYLQGSFTSFMVT